MEWMMLSYLPLMLIAVVAAFAVWRAVQRSSDFQELSHQGTLVTGEVLSKQKRRAGKSRRLRYAFVTPEGMRCTNRVLVSASEWDHYTEGSKIDLVYLPHRPSVSATREMVNHSRRAVSLPPL